MASEGNVKAINDKNLHLVYEGAFLTGRRRTVSSLLGITGSTFNKYYTTGRRYIEDNPEIETYNQCENIEGKVYLAFEKGRADLELKRIERISRHGEKDWKADAYVMKHIFKNDEENYNDDNKISIGGEITTDVSSLSTDELYERVMQSLLLLNMNGGDENEKESV